MEAMTEAMHFLAVKTKQETVSMRIITLVTLFFLPGTFISVSYLILLYKLVSKDSFPGPKFSHRLTVEGQTIMSTDIIQFQDSKEIFSLGALQLYLAITLPLMALTFAAWWLVYWYVNRKQDTEAFGGRFSGWIP
jgi:ABC-type Fe3+ transport system permease subunit